MRRRSDGRLVFRITHSAFRIPNSAFRFPSSGFRIRIPNSEFRISPSCPLSTPHSSLLLTLGVSCPKGRILIVDDEAGIRSTLRQILEDEGYLVEEAETGEDALPLATGGDHDVILLDVWLPGMDGLEVLQRMRERGVPGEVLVISGHGTIETAVRATKLGAYDFIGSLSLWSGSSLCSGQRPEEAPP